MIAASLLLRRGASKSHLFFSFSSQRIERSTLAFDMAERKDKLEGFKVIKEGEVEIQLDVNNGVFYNKTQVNNRDMSIAVLRTFISKRKEVHAAMLSKKMNSEAKLLEGIAAEPVIKESSMHANEPNGITKETNKNSVWEGKHQLKEPRVLEALAASGLRALRYAREIDGIGQVIALDNDQGSIEICKKNIQFNGPVAASKVEAHLADARVYMLTHSKEFDVVDIDPYGSPSMFLDSAVQSVTDGGMLMCTATDMAVLCGDDRDVCYSKYGSYPPKGKYCQEMALRVLLASIESHANRYKRHIVPVLSVYMDFYIRVFVRIFTSGIATKEAPLKLSYVYQCVGCDSFHLQCLGTAVTENKNTRYAPGFGPIVHKECSDCRRRFRMGGPIWSAPIHDPEWVASILSNVKAMKERYPAYKRISAVLTTISEELLDVPLFLSLHNLCATVKCSSPSAAMFRSAVINAGYRISGTHVNPLGLKTDAPMSIIWDIMRCWVEKHPSKGQPSDQPGAAILLQKPTLQANFAAAVGSMSKARKEKIARFLPKPEKNWGPKLRAGRKISSKHASQLGHENVKQVLGHQDANGKSPSLSLEEGAHMTCNSSANNS